jgi:DNA-binding XRE family transcriptional regulator
MAVESARQPPNMGAVSTYLMDSPLSTIWNSNGKRTTLSPVSRATLRKREREALGRAVRVLRAERGVSQETVEDAGGLGQNALSRIERGDVSPSFDSLVGVAAGLGIPLSVLVATYERQLEGGARATRP